jgi:inhibitor of cysteine peptidase
MKKLILSCSILIILGVLMTACSGNTEKITQDNNGQTISVVNGSKFTVSLAGNPTTGFNWELAKMLSLVGEPEYKADSSLIGSGGMVTYTFQVLEAGTTNLKLVYRRSWEKDIAPEQTFEVIVEATVK